VSPTCVGLPGKPRAGGNPGWRGTQRGARRLRGCRSIPIQTYPEWILGIGLGDPDRSERKRSGCVFRKWGRGWCDPHHLPLPPVIGETQNPVAVCPTGAALRPTNRRGVSSGDRWLGREPPGSRGQPEGVAQGGYPNGIETLAVRIASVRSWGWDTPYGEQNASVRVALASLRPS